jgi:hypothetical protein
MRTIFLHFWSLSTAGNRARLALLQGEIYFGRVKSGAAVDKAASRDS